MVLTTEKRMSFDWHLGHRSGTPTNQIVGGISHRNSPIAPIIKNAIANRIAIAASKAAQGKMVSKLLAISNIIGRTFAFIYMNTRAYNYMQ
jgi:hypothetical protein